MYQNNMIMKKEIKKKYESPEMRVYDMELPVILAGSGVENSIYEIEYGGIDDSGVLEVD